MKPTEAQVKEFWEGYGWKQSDGGFYKHPSIAGAEYYDYATQGTLPPIDLNNLFKYAVPVAIAILAIQPIGCPSIIQIYKWIFERWAEELKEESDPTTALFKALDKVRRHDGKY